MLRHTGLRPRQTLSVKKNKDFEVPKPVKVKPKAQGDEDHGLWAFFPEDKKLLRTPAEESQFDKPWTVDDLETYFERQGVVDVEGDLHSLWWACVKERNRLATEKLERARVEAGYGDHENQQRDEAVQKTMKAILDLLDQRKNTAPDAEEYLDDPYSDVPEYEDSKLEAKEPQPEVQRDNQVHNIRAEDQEEPKQKKELPESSFFNTSENPPTFKERMKDRAKKVLWNK